MRVFKIPRFSPRPDCAVRSVIPLRVCSVPMYSTGQEFGADVITEDLSEYIAIALLVVHEKTKGKDSFWSSYIGVLPTVEDVRRAHGTVEG